MSRDLETGYDDDNNDTPQLVRVPCPDCEGEGCLPDPERPNLLIDCGECKGLGYYLEYKYDRE